MAGTPGGGRGMAVLLHGSGTHISVIRFLLVLTTADGESGGESDSWTDKDTDDYSDDTSSDEEDGDHAVSETADVAMEKEQLADAASAGFDGAIMSSHAAVANEAETSQQVVKEKKSAPRKPPVPMAERERAIYVNVVRDPEIQAARMNLPIIGEEQVRTALPLVGLITSFSAKGYFLLGDESVLIDANDYFCVL